MNANFDFETDWEMAGLGLSTLYCFRQLRRKRVQQFVERKYLLPTVKPRTGMLVHSCPASAFDVAVTYSSQTFKNPIGPCTGIFADSTTTHQTTNGLTDFYSARFRTGFYEGYGLLDYEDGSSKVIDLGTLERHFARHIQAFIQATPPQSHSNFPRSFLIGLALVHPSAKPIVHEASLRIPTNSGFKEEDVAFLPEVTATYTNWNEETESLFEYIRKVAGY